MINDGMMASSEEQ